MATAAAAKAPARRRRVAQRSLAPARRRTAARRAPERARASRPRARRAHSVAPPPRLVPVAVGRAAVAVGDLADSGVVQRLTRGRLWIGALTPLLVGIVALNVMALSINASTSKVAAQAEELNRANSALRTEIAGELSNEHIQRVAARLGLLVPDPASILYLRPRGGDAQRAARRLASGDLAGSGLPAAPIVPVAPVAPTLASEAPTEPAAETVTPEVTDPADPAAAAPPPAAPPAEGAAAGGGVGAP